MKQVAYTVLDLLTGKKGVARTVNGFKVRFPARWSRYYQSTYEPDNYALLAKKLKPGMHVIDIGAHIGLFSVRSSQLAGDTGRIICFEPTPGTFKILQETLRLNHCGNVMPVQAAVSDKEGLATFYVSDVAGCNSNSLIQTKAEKELSSYEVKLYTIDSVVSQFEIQPSLIKIDAEGAELDVLKGGVSTFKKHKPVLILGLHPAFIKQKGDSLEAIWDLLSQVEYRVLTGDRLMTREEFCGNTLLFDVECSPVN